MKEKTISRTFQIGLALIVAIALTASTLFLFILNTRINTKNYEDIIRTTLDDIEKDIEDTSDINMLDQTFRLKGKVEAILRAHPSNAPENEPKDDSEAINDALRTIAAEEELIELNVIGADNIIIYSNKKEYIGFDMSLSEDTFAFDVLNHGATELVQPVRQNAYHDEGNYEQYNKYAGVPLSGGGYLQVAISSRQFQKQIDEKLNYIAANRHIGQTGYAIISNIKDTIISIADRSEVGEETQTLPDIGLTIKRGKNLGKTFTSEINGKKHLCISRFVEGYYITGAVPTAEVQSFRNRSVLMNTLTEILILALLFFSIYRMIRSTIVSPINSINYGLNRIIGGELDTTIDEYSTKEFSELSRDINSTVKSLRDYMAREQKQIRQELEFARNIQMGALPKASSLAPYPGFVLSAAIRPAREVGGDFYDFYMLDDSHLVVLIADVSGKGVPGAMFMMTCKTMLKNLVEAGMTPDEVFDRANEELCESNDAGMFVTAWMGVLDLKTGHLRYVNAGHNPPLFYNDEGKYDFLRGKAELVLTGVPGMKYTLRELDLKPGDRFFLYTDGVTEANNPQGEMYGNDRLRDYLNSAEKWSLDGLLSGLQRDIDRFARRAEQFDDITMVAVQYQQKP